MTDTAGANNTSDLLNQLRDIQEPIAPQGTPLWLIVLTIAVAVFLIAAIGFQRHRRRYAFRHEALARVDKIANESMSENYVHGAGEHNNTRDSNRSRSLFELATLLRQLMRHRRGDAVNSLDESEWLSALDAEFNSQWFSQGRGAVFGSMVYQRRSINDSDFANVCSELKAEIRRLKPVASEN